jgi:hypothetical protein
MARHLTVLVAALAALAPAQESRPAHFDASGWQVLFDGATLDGWVTKGGHYDGDARWSVEDHVICGREGDKHAGGLLYTAKKHTSFLFSVDVWMTRPNDSGIFVRMAPDGRGAQVTLDDYDGGEIGAVYSDEFLVHNTKARKKWKPSAWNRVEVRVTGRDMHVEAWIDGEKVTDHQILPGTQGYAATGLIGLQVHGSRSDPPGTIVKFRDIRVRDLPAFDAIDFDCDEQGVMQPTAKGVEHGWKLLSDGTTFDPAVWKDRGFLKPADESASKPVLGGSIGTIEDYGDFELHCDFRLDSPGANSGVYLRASPDDPNPSFSGCEIQILDDANWERLNKQKLKPWQFCGSIYGSSAPRVRGVLNPVGNWNSYRIVYQGNRLNVWLNGVLIQEADVTTLDVPEHEKKFAERRKTGFIGFQRYSEKDLVSFRNVFVRKVT